MSWVARLLPAAAAALAVAGCGSTPGAADTVAATQGGLASIHSGRLGMRLTMATPSSGEVGFALAGPFSIGDRGTQARIDDTRLAGPQQATVTVTSTGGRVWVTSGGTTTPVTGDVAAPFGPGTGGAGLDALHLDRWVTDPTQSDGPSIDGAPTRRVDGHLAAAATLGDLVGLIQASSGRTAAPLAASASQLTAAVRASSFSLVTGRDDHLLRSLDVSLVLAGTGTPQLGAAFGDVSSLTLRLHLEIHDVNGPVSISAPATAG